jgi:hypothetical protein
MADGYGREYQLSHNIGTDRFPLKNSEAAYSGGSIRSIVDTILVVDNDVSAAEFIYVGAMKVPAEATILSVAMWGKVAESGLDMVVEVLSNSITPVWTGLGTFQIAGATSYEVIPGTAASADSVLYPFECRKSAVGAPFPNWDGQIRLNPDVIVNTGWIGAIQVNFQID